MPETPMRFSASIVKNDGTHTPLREYNVTQSYDQVRNVQFFVCFIESLPSTKFAISVKSRDPNQSRMGAMIFMDNIEQNRVGLRPGFAVQLTGRPLTPGVEQAFVFPEKEDASGSIRIELWRSIVIQVEEGAVTYGQEESSATPTTTTTAKVELVGTPVTQISKVQYLDKHPALVFLFEYRSKKDLAQMSLIELSGRSPLNPLDMYKLDFDKVAKQQPSSSAAVANFGPRVRPLPLTSPHSRSTDPVLTQDVIRRVLIQAIDNPATAHSLIQACIRRHGQDIVKCKETEQKTKA